MRAPSFGSAPLRSAATSVREYHHSSRVCDCVFPGEQEAPYQRWATRSLTVWMTVAETKNVRRMIMKTILSALLALSVLAGIAAPASAYGEYNRNGDRDVGQSSPL